MNKMHEIFNREVYDNLLDKELPLSKDEKSRILDMTLEKIPSNENKKLSKKKLMASVLIAIMMIGTIAMADEYFESNLDNAFLNLLSINKNDTSLDSAAVNVNKTVSQNGLDLTIKQTLGDDHSIYIILDVVVPKDIEIPENAYFNTSNINLDKSGGIGWSFQELNNKYDDNKKSYIIDFSSQAKLTNNKITLDFYDFGYYSEKNKKFITLVEGNWKLSWDLKYNNTSKTFKVNHFVKENHYKSIITSISISPISIYVNLLGDNYDNFNISKITMKNGIVYNGEMYNLSNRECIFSSASSGSSLFKSYTSGNFTKILDVDEIDSITIGNEVIKINN